MEQERAQELRSDVEKRLREGKSYSMHEIRQIMKESGLSYRQVIQRAKAMKKNMKQAEQQAEAEGRAFDEAAYLSKCMEGGGEQARRMCNEQD